MRHDEATVQLAADATLVNGLGAICAFHPLFA
jgi:hypothetical protein